jgi:hypothetical protein
MKHLKCESENGKVGQENTDSIGLNIENDAFGSGYFRSIFIFVLDHGRCLACADQT